MVILCGRKDLQTYCQTAGREIPEPAGKSSFSATAIEGDVDATKVGLLLGAAVVGSEVGDKLVGCKLGGVVLGAGLGRCCDGTDRWFEVRR